MPLKQQHRQQHNSYLFFLFTICLYFSPQSFATQTITETSSATTPSTVPSTVPSTTLYANEFTAYYESSKNYITGHTVVSLKKNKLQYQYKTVTTVTGIMSLFSNSAITESSNWKFVKNQIRPDQYLYQRTGSKERKVELFFDWDKSIVTNKINSDPWRMPIKSNTLDKFIYQLVMMRDLQNISNSKDKLIYSIADGGNLKTYTINILGKEKIKTKLGKLDVIKVSRTSGKRTTTLWCAEKLGYLPVRINQKKKDGSDYTADIIKLEGNPGFN